MLGQKTARDIATAVDAQNLGAVRRRWGPLMAALAEADVLSAPRMAPPGARPPTFTADAAALARDRLDGFIRDVREIAGAAVMDLLGGHVASRGWAAEGLDAPAEWAVAWAEHGAFSKVVFSGKGASAAVFAAAAAGAETAAVRLAEADRLAWEIVAARGIGPEELQEMAERRWKRLGPFLSSVVRHAAAVSDGAPEPIRAAMASAAGAIAWSGAEKWEWEALGELVSGCEPSAEPDWQQAVPARA